MRLPRAHAGLAFLMPLLLAPAEAQLMLPQIFKDGVVLQHTKPIVFGYATPGETVTVAITPEGGGGAASFSAEASGRDPCYPHTAATHSLLCWTVRNHCSPHAATHSLLWLTYPAAVDVNSTLTMCIPIAITITKCDTRCHAHDTMYMTGRRCNRAVVGPGGAARAGSVG